MEAATTGLAPAPVTHERPLPPIEYPEDLPVSEQRHKIAEAILHHQVVIVCGETGSGKTTQLPKICLELGRGQQGMIGHTQPRRLAATSVARRIAEELKTEIGDWVGFQIRFSDKTGPRSAIKLMTDGILLAESQRDPLLGRYDTLIIDEAHERSLNIDFLLGFLRQLLPQRPDLKLIITSATIDAGRFAEHFAHKGKPAPVIEVSGRLYPVELRYRPVRPDKAEVAQGVSARQAAASTVPDDEKDLIDALVAAVDECAQHGAGDVLVFLPGEREIRETAQALQKAQGPGTQVLPLYARLSPADQERIFRPSGNARRIVLATNVAETSLTVPGIRFVVDSGLARVKRYSWRNKVEQLQIEPISQASANQRAGRCGRVGPGVCIRLYDEADYKLRPPFTDPEILRSSLASVILRMKSLGLHDIEGFPFVDPPSGRAIADGYHILQELGALDAQNVLTKVGRELARLPLDPRLARMILEAKGQQCLDEVLVVASALSVQDPRDRSLQERDAARQAHSRFRDPKSEFVSYVKLWRWYHEHYQNRESQRKFQSLLREHFLSPVRFREWRDVHTQLLALVRQQGWRINTTDATYEQIHRALLSGLLGNVGTKGDDGEAWLGARGIRFYIHPGSDLLKKAGRWIMSAELVETTRLYARCIAQIDPRWLEQAGAHLLVRTWSDPRWDRKSGQVIANERATLYGLPVYHGRKVHFGRIDPEQAREIFIREALVVGEIDTQLAFIRHNRKLIAQIEKLEHRARRPDILVDEELIYAFYDKAIPADVCQTVSLETWARGLDKEQADALLLTRDELMRHEAAGVTTDVFPRSVSWQGIDMALDYHFEPGSVRDGVTLTVPVFALNKIDAARCEWLVPGMLKDKVQLLVRSLPQKLRRHCVPLPEYAAGFYERWFDRLDQPGVDLLDAIADDMWQQRRVRPVRSDFKPETLPAHLFMNFKVVDENGRMLAGGRNLDQLKAAHAPQAQASFQRMAASDERVAEVLAQDELTTWSFGALPELMEIQRNGQSFIGYPALVDHATHCRLDVFDDPAEARETHRQGLICLFRLALKEQVRQAAKNLPDFTRASLHYMSLGSQEQLRDQIIDRAISLSCLTEPLPSDQAGFEARCAEARTRFGLLVQEVGRLAAAILLEWAEVQKKQVLVRAHAAAHADIKQQLEALVSRGFVRDTPQEQLAHFPRYLKAVQVRIEKLRTNPARDTQNREAIAPLLLKYQRARQALRGEPDVGLDEFRWLLEELRVGLFAQELRTPMPVSVKRLEKKWAALYR